MGLITHSLVKQILGAARYEPVSLTRLVPYGATSGTIGGLGLEQLPTRT